MCSVVNCDSSRRSVQRYILPEDPEKRLQWVQFVFEVNGQRLKESSCADITICGEHFTHDCFEYAGDSGFAQLKPSAVPSVCVKSEPEEPELQIKVEEPESHIKLEEPESHIKLEEPEPGHVKVEGPEPDRVKLELLEPVHVKVEEIQQEHVKIEQPKPENVNAPESQIVCLPEPEHQNPPEAEPVEPVEFVINSGDTDSDNFDEVSNPSSIDNPVSPVPSDTSEVSTFDYDQMLQKIENIDVIKEKVALLRMKRKYVVNENRLLQLFSSKCPLCGSKVKVEKVKCNLFIVIDQQCLQCDYGKHWKSQSSGPFPTAEDQVISEVVTEESDFMDEMEESIDEDSDDDWIPTEELLFEERLQADSDEDNEENHMFHRQLCVDCGKFYIKEPHTCEHKLKPYSCNICGKRCANETALVLHSKVHNEKYVHLCKYCHMEFKTKGDKITHEQIHLTEKDPFKCSECSQVFAESKKRQNHMKEHPEAPSVCHVCGMKFDRKHQLQRHSIVHTGLMPFECSVCQRNFNQSSHLKSHMRLHTGDRPFKCQHCDKCFTHNVSLKSHVLRYHTSDSKQTCAVPELAEVKRSKKPRRRRSSIFRPIGRPKKNPASNVENGGRGSNSRSGTSKARKLNRTQPIDEESEDELTESNVSSDSNDKEERVTLNSSRSKGKRKKSDIDTDFDPGVSKKKRHIDQNSGKNSGKQDKRTRSNKNQDT
ncbi:Zinc finger 813 [Solea senegalensis]|uniref:Zinc finger 813 n=1 Tax=Solea senegalensis TaxID=28829 RepID=A0AAV6T907_SOLSE|nr:zinc finger protein 69 homolog isoform X1 [Solea senegalensis]KAG7525908.1 Zinc finger 813 [Solea senegalensis]